jgi:predicted phosphodiesterase
VDNGDWAVAYPATKLVRLAGRSIYILHDLKTLQVDPIARGIDVVVSGHSHVPKSDTTDAPRQEIQLFVASQKRRRT